MTGNHSIVGLVFLLVLIFSSFAQILVVPYFGVVGASMSVLVGSFCINISLSVYAYKKAGILLLPFVFRRGGYA